MPRTFTLTINIPDEMTVADLTRSIGYVREHFDVGLTEVQRATQTPPNTTGTVWAGHGGILGAFALGPVKSAAIRDLTLDGEEPMTMLLSTFKQLDAGLDAAMTATRGVIETLGELIAQEAEERATVGISAERKCANGHPWSPMIGSCIGVGCGSPEEA